MKLSLISAAAAAMALAMTPILASADDIPDDEATVTTEAEVSSTPEPVTGTEPQDYARLEAAPATVYVEPAPATGRIATGANSSITASGQRFDSAGLQIATTEEPVTTTVKSTATLSNEDREFFEKAAIIGMTEIEAAKIAQQKGAAGDTKSFASMMLTDHSKADAQLKALAASKGVTLPAAPDKKHQDLLADLQKKSGADFEDAYADAMSKGHKDAVDLFEKTAKKAGDADVRAFAEKTLPTLRTHLSLAKDLDSKK